MKYDSVLNRYIFAEIFQPFILNIGFFSFIFLLFQMLEIIDMIVNYRISLLTVLHLIVYSMPYFLVFVFPMSAMTSVLLTVLRMSNDNELIALRAGGVSMYALVPPIMGFCLIAAIMTAAMSVWAMPWGMFQFKHTAFRLATSNLEIGIKERTFNDSFKDVMLYVNRIDLKTRTFTDVFIEDRRTAKISVTVVAPKGKLISEPETGTFHLLLFDGTINQVDLEKRSVNAIRFDKYQVSLDARKAMSSAKNFQKGPKEMSLEELNRYIESLKSEKNAEYYLALLDFHKRFSVPFACFALGFLAIPLGIRAKSARKSFGIGLGLGFFILYYMMLSAGLVFGEAGVYPPIIGMWVPNIVTTAIGVRLFDNINRDRPLRFRLRRF
jgi:lipopolysaccharide export system permease protein